MMQHMSDATTSTILDSTQYGNNGTKKAANEPQEVAGAVGKAQQFDGSNDYVNVGNSNKYLGGNFTIGVWANAGIKDWHYILGNGIYNEENAFAIALREDFPSTGYSVYYDTTGGNPKTLPSGVSDTGVWKYITVTYDNSSLKIYIDGVFKASASRSGTFVSGNLWIGSYGGDQRYFNGTIDEVRISNVARSANWILAGYELVMNQSTYVTWGAATTCPCPPTIANTTGPFWANFTFTPDNTGCPLTTDGYNVSWNNGTDSGWANTTDAWANITAAPHNYLNVTIWSWNASEDVLSCDNVTLSLGPWPNNAPVLLGCEDIFYGASGFNATLDLNYTDLDGDTCTFSTDFPYGTLNETTGEFTWAIPPDMFSVYYANFTVNDSYGGEDTCTATIGNLDMLMYLQSIELVEAQEMLGGAFIVFFLLAAGLILFLLGLYAGNAILTLMATALFFIALTLPAPLFEGYIAIALIGVLLILGLVALMYSFYLFWAAYSSHRSWHKWDSYFEEQR